MLLVQSMSSPYVVTTLLKKHLYNIIFIAGSLKIIGDDNNLPVRNMD